MVAVASELRPHVQTSCAPRVGNSYTPVPEKHVFQPVGEIQEGFRRPQATDRLSGMDHPNPGRPGDSLFAVQVDLGLPLMG